MKKGISLVVLVITIVLMIILASIAIINMDNVFLNTNLSLLQTDISQIEALMNTYKIRKSGNIDFHTVQFDTSSLSASELLQFSGESVIDNKIELYVIGLEEIDAEGSNYGDLTLGSKDRYLYSKTTEKVYYEQGLKIGNEVYYYSKTSE